MVVYSSEKLTLSDFANLIQEKFTQNVSRLDKLQNYYIGKHDILKRAYTDNQKPNNKITVNYCNVVADFITSYLCGVPIEYRNAPATLLKTLEYNDDAATVNEFVTNMNIFGYGVELLYIDTDGEVRYTSVDPREFVFVFDNTLKNNLRYAIRTYLKETIKNKISKYYVDIYDSEQIKSYILEVGRAQLQPNGTHKHIFKEPPVILYQNNRDMIGSFEQVMPLQDALNKITSDEVNDFEGLVDSYLVIPNSAGQPIEDFLKLKQERVLLTGENSEPYWLVKDVKNSFNLEVKASTIRQIKELGRLPDFGNVSGFAVNGEALRFALTSTEILASKQERTLTKGIQRRIELIYNALKIKESYLSTKIKFTRNFIMDENERSSENGRTEQPAGTAAE